MTCSMTLRAPHSVTGWLEAEGQAVSRVSDLPSLLSPPYRPTAQGARSLRSQLNVPSSTQEDSKITKILLAESKNCCLLGKKSIQFAIDCI